MDLHSEVLRKLKTRRDGRQPLNRPSTPIPISTSWTWSRSGTRTGCSLVMIARSRRPATTLLSRSETIRSSSSAIEPAPSGRCTIRAATAVRASAPAQKGSSAKLVCPYHQWTYELDGKLLFARQMGEDFDKAQHRPEADAIAKPSAAISSSASPTSLWISSRCATWSRPMSRRTGLQDTKVAFESTIIEKGNWKLVWENNRECYHCAANHPELCRTYPEAPTATGVQGAKDDPIIAAHWAKCEAEGLPSEFRMSPSRPVSAWPACR